MISAEHDRTFSLELQACVTFSLELQACVRVPDVDAFLLFHRLRVTTEIGMAFIPFQES